MSAVFQSKDASRKSDISKDLLRTSFKQPKLSASATKYFATKQDSFSKPRDCQKKHVKLSDIWLDELRADVSRLHGPKLESLDFNAPKCEICHGKVAVLKCWDCQHFSCAICFGQSHVDKCKSRHNIQSVFTLMNPVVTDQNSSLNVKPSHMQKLPQRKCSQPSPDQETPLFAPSPSIDLSKSFLSGDFDEEQATSDFQDAVHAFRKSNLPIPEKRWFSFPVDNTNCSTQTDGLGTRRSVSSSTSVSKAFATSPNRTNKNAKATISEARANNFVQQASWFKSGKVNLTNSNPDTSATTDILNLEKVKSNHLRNNNIGKVVECKNMGPDQDEILERDVAGESHQATISSLFKFAGVKNLKHLPTRV